MRTPSRVEGSPRISTRTAEPPGISSTERVVCWGDDHRMSDILICSRHRKSPVEIAQMRIIFCAGSPNLAGPLFEACLIFLPHIVPSISPVHWKIARGAHFVFPRDRVRPQNGRLVTEDHLSGGDAACCDQAPAAAATAE